MRRYLLLHMPFRVSVPELVGVPVPSPEELLEWDWLRPRTLGILSTIAWKYRMASGQEQAAINKFTARILDKIIEVSHEHSARPVITDLPNGAEIYSEKARKRAESFMMKFCQGRDDLECFSARPEFASRIARGIEFRRQGHWGPEGHRAVVRSIYEFLIEHGYVCAS